MREMAIAAAARGSEDSLNAQATSMANISKLAKRQYTELEGLEPPPELKDYHHEQLFRTSETAENFGRYSKLAATASTAIANADQDAFYEAMQGMLKAPSAEEVGPLDGPLAISYLKRRRSDDLASYLVQAYELDQDEGPSGEDCITDELLGLSEEAFDERVILCLESELPEAMALDRRWQTLVPPAEAVAYHQERLQLSSGSTAQLSSLLTTTRGGGDLLKLPRENLIAEWMRLQITWNSLAIMALTR